MRWTSIYWSRVEKSHFICFSKVNVVSELQLRPISIYQMSVRLAEEEQDGDQVTDLSLDLPSSTDVVDRRSLSNHGIIQMA